jgi:hypothetical protein
MDHGQLIAFGFVLGFCSGTLATVVALAIRLSDQREKVAGMPPGHHSQGARENSLGQAPWPVPFAAPRAK